MYLVIEVHNTVNDIIRKWICYVDELKWPSHMNYWICLNLFTLITLKDQNFLFIKACSASNNDWLILTSKFINQDFLLLLSRYFELIEKYMRLSNNDTIHKSN